MGGIRRKDYGVILWHCSESAAAYIAGGDAGTADFLGVLIIRGTFARRRDSPRHVA